MFESPSNDLDSSLRMKTSERSSQWPLSLQLFEQISSATQRISSGMVFLHVFACFLLVVFFGKPWLFFFGGVVAV